VDVATYLEHLAAEGNQLATAARAAGLDAEVPGCPGWVVRDLLAHIGEVHRWAATIVREARHDPNVGAPAVPGDDALLDWYVDGHAALLDTLRQAPTDLDCFTFLPAPSPLEFWARRQALETAMHRVDAEGAAGDVAPLDDELAANGIDEILAGFGARKKQFTPGTIRLEPTGSAPWAVPWLVTLRDDGITAVPDPPDEPADATVAGSVSDLYRWLWNRPATVEISGDGSVAARWTDVRIRWG
jgi:uncharacterized protein (TIGR03083 family)